MNDVNDALRDSAGGQPPIVEPAFPARPPLAASGTAAMLHPNSVTADRLESWITTGVITLVALLGLGIWHLLAPPPLWGSVMLLVAWLLLAGLLAWVSHVLPRWGYEHTWYRVDQSGVEIHRGIFWKHVVNVPLARVQHTDVSQGPLMRRFGLGTLVMYTAGTEHASVELGGLAYETALELRDILVHGGRAGDVESEQ